MGNLPEDRVQPFRPFENIGVDFGGPFFVKPVMKSKMKTKYYLALFVCFVTKAIHLEMVSDLSLASFLMFVFVYLFRGVVAAWYCKILF